MAKKMTREEIIERIEEYLPWADEYEVNIEMLEGALELLKQETKTWSLDDARDDFVSDVYNTFDFLPTNNEANRIIESFDRVTSGIKQEPCEDAISRQAALDEAFEVDTKEYGRIDVVGVDAIDALPPVTPTRKIEQKPCEDVMAIHTQGLDEGIRCAMCTNSMKSDRGCDGGCVVDEKMYKEVMEVINKQMFELSTSDEPIT